jgi:molybdopterin biosynthesis enzyme
VKHAQPELNHPLPLLLSKVRLERSEGIINRTMISLQDALNTLHSASEDLYTTLHNGEEDCVLLEWAVDRIAKYSYYSPRATPAYDTSVMDGFALCSAMTTSASSESPVTFCVYSNIVRAGGDCPNISRGDIEGATAVGSPVLSRL